MRLRIISLVLLLLSFVFSSAQRKSENLNRGVVAVKNASSAYFISWRYLATDPENIQFNLYAKKSGAASFSKLNASPLTVTNYQSTTSQVATGTQLYVKPVISGVEGTASLIYTVNSSVGNLYRNGYIDITYNAANDGLDLSLYKTKFIWPADLDGDGEYDFVVDRLSQNGGTHKIQAYLRTGTLLWTIDVGPNVSISTGQDDMVIAYDMDGDGYAEVVLKSSDGTVFANGKGVNGSTTLDTDNDGIIDYGAQTVRNPPQYISVVNGQTGIEKTSIEMTYPSNYTRTNKAIFMSEDYSNLNGHMSVLYLDGKHPSVGFIYKTRTASDQYHWYYASAWGYNASGQFVNQFNWERGLTDAAEFHSIRAADVDFDGRDELLDGGFGLKYDGSLAFNAHISHGDRFRVGDINPERPGLETFAIQQNASSMLGMIVYDASTGTAINKKFMSGVGDVGRGECMDIDSTQLGYEYYSTMANIYNAKGEVLFEGDAPWPFEGLWWDGDLSRETFSAADGNGYNATIDKYNMSTHAFGRMLSIYSITSYGVESEYGARPAFFGDIAGDWREEILLRKKGKAADGVTVTNPGFVGFSTDYPTTNRIYCLMQNPAYRMQATTKGYYQSALPDYYLGTQMPTPPVPAVQSARLTWKTGANLDKSAASWVLADEKTSAVFADGDDIMFDISGASTSIAMNTDLAPSKVWAMNPSGKDYAVTGTGKFTGTMELVKSMAGKFSLNGSHTYTGKTTVSEGTLAVNGSLSSQVDLRAKGTLMGNATLNGGVIFNKGLNIEGGRIAPGNGLDAASLGKITINAAASLPGNVNLHFDIIPASSYKNDSLVINGNLTATGINNIVVNTVSGTLPAGTYSLLKWTGTLTGSLSNFTIKGISGLPVTLVIENSTLKLVVSAVRSTGSIIWTGSVNSTLDFSTNNFTLSSTPTYFVTGDAVTVNDAAVNTSLVMNDNFNASGWQFANNSKAITVSGTGGFSGSGNVTYAGSSQVDVQTVNHIYTGITALNNARVKIAELSEAGSPGSLGAASATASNLTLSASALLINATNTYTNRGMTLTGSDTIQIVKSTGVATVTGILTGTGKLIKNGPGQLNLSGSVSNTYSGGTMISEGTLALGSITMNKTGLGSGAITLQNGGVLKMFYSDGDYTQNPNWNLSVPSGQSGTLIASGRCNINGTISGGGTLYYNIPYVRADMVATGTSFTGYLNVTTDADGGEFRVTANSTGFPNAQVYLNNLVGMSYYASVGASSASTATTAIIGSLAGASGSSLNTGKWQIGSDNRDAVFDGVINSGAIITKVGTGNWTLTNANLCTSTINVNAGKLTVANATGSATGTSAVVVGTSGTLSGTGTVTGNTTINGKLEGNIVFGSNLVLASASQTTLDIKGFTAGLFDKINVSGQLTKAGTLKIVVSGVAPAQNTSVQLIQAGTSTGAFGSVIVPTGYTYDAATSMLTYQGTVSPVWNGTGNWSDVSKWEGNSLPSVDSKVVIQSGHVFVNQAVVVDSLIVEPGAKITVNAGQSLTAKIILNSDAYGTATLVNLGTCNAVTSKISQKITAGRNWYFSSPLQSVTFNNLIDVSGLSANNPKLGPDESSLGLLRYWQFNENDTSWSEITNLSSTLTPLKGYVMNLGIDTTITFSGNFNDGNLTYSVNRTENVLPKRGFNLVGNPYPSYLDWNLVDKINITPSIWYRTRNAGNAYVFDTYNSTGEIATSLGTQAVTNLIPPMQSFWVRVTAGQTSGTINLTNAMRAHKDVAGNLMKVPAAISQILRLKVDFGSNTDETVLYFNPAATSGYDDYDSQKMMNNSAQIPDIYTMIGSDEIVINGMPGYFYGQQIPIGFNCSASGTYTISASQILNFDADTKIILIDNQTGINTNLSVGNSYTFSSGVTSGTSRFSVKFLSISGTTEIPALKNQFKVYEADGHILVHNISGFYTDAAISVFNMAGQKLFTQKTKGQITTLNHQFLPGIYMVQIENVSGKIVYKILLK